MKETDSEEELKEAFKSRSSTWMAARRYDFRLGPSFAHAPSFPHHEQPRREAHIEYVDEMIHEAASGVDGDGDRQINCEEFVKIMMSTLRVSTETGQAEV